MSNSMEMVKMQENFNKGILDGKEHFYAIMLNTLQEETCIVTRNTIIPIIKYNLLYRDDYGVIIKKSMDFTTNTSNGDTGDNYTLLLRESIEDGEMLIYKDKTPLNYIHDESKFDLIFDAICVRGEKGSEYPISVVVTYNANSPNSLALAIFDKRKGIVNIENLMREIMVEGELIHILDIEKFIKDNNKIAWMNTVDDGVNKSHAMSETPRTKDCLNNISSGYVAIENLDSFVDEVTIESSDCRNLDSIKISLLFDEITDKSLEYEDRDSCYIDNDVDINFITSDASRIRNHASISLDSVPLDELGCIVNEVDIEPFDLLDAVSECNKDPLKADLLIGELANENSEYEIRIESNTDVGPSQYSERVHRIFQDITLKKESVYFKDEHDRKRKTDRIEINGFAQEVTADGDFLVINKQLYWYNDIFWEKVDKVDFMTIIKTTYEEADTMRLFNRDYNEIYAQVLTNSNIHKRNRMNKESYFINFRNGVYDIINDCMLDHEKKYYFFSYINYDFIPTYSGGNVFEEYIQYCSKSNAEIRSLIMQMMGYIISDLVKAKAFFVLLGDRDTGKSTFGNLITSIIGEENRSAVNFHELTEKWTPATLHGKKLVLDMDVSTETISKGLVAMVNKLTGNNVVVGKEKYKNQFTFVNTCKILIAANTLPTLQRSKHEDAFVKRMVVIPFGETIPDECKDPDLLDKLKLERNYIVTQAMKALRDLINNNFQFRRIDGVDNLKSNLLISSIPSHSNIVKEFIQHYCTTDSEAFTPTAYLYDAYMTYIKEAELNYKPLSSAHFGIVLTKLLGTSSQAKRNQQRGYVGIRLLLE